MERVKYPVMVNSFDSRICKNYLSVTLCICEHGFLKTPIQMHRWFIELSLQSCQHNFLCVNTMNKIQCITSLVFNSDTNATHVGVPR